MYAHSNFGCAFRNFVADHIGAVNKRTTVIVLGDARNNYNLPHDWCLREIRQRASRIIWLNPESRNTWGFGDSEMERYAPHCDLVEECRNLNQLYRVVDQLGRRAERCARARSRSGSLRLTTEPCLVQDISDGDARSRAVAQTRGRCTSAKASRDPTHGWSQRRFHSDDGWRH